MSNKIKILYIVTQDEWGGAQRYVFDLVSGIGSEFEVVLAVGNPKVEKGLLEHIAMAKAVLPEKFEHVKTAILPHLQREISFKNDKAATQEIRDLIISEQPDIVHLNSSKVSILGSLALRGIQKSKRPKTVYTVHGWVFNEPLSIFKKTAYRWAERLFAKSKDAIIVLSNEDLKTGICLGAGDKLTLIPHGLELTRLHDAHDAKLYINNLLKAKLDLSALWFVTIANAYATKGLDVLLAAVNKNRDALSNANFFIIGGGPELEKLKREAATLNLENVFFCGALPFADSYLRAFDIFVLPSRKEGLPYALLEARSAGLPIIATHVGGVPSLIEDKKSGLLVNPDNATELGEALRYAVEHPGEMQTMAKNAPQPNTLESMILTTSSLYLKLLAKR